LGKSEIVTNPNSTKYVWLRIVQKEGEKMPCPVCGRVMCDCTPDERGQTQAQMRDIYAKDYNENCSKKKKK